MSCACSGEQFKFEETPQSPESLAASGISSRTGDWESEFEDVQVDEAESTLNEVPTLLYGGAETSLPPHLHFELLAGHVEQVSPGIYERAKRCYVLALCYAAAGRNEVALNLLKKVFGQSKAKRKPHILALLFGAYISSQDPKHAHHGITFARDVVDLEDEVNGHFKGQAHKFLGICYGNAARISISDSERALFQKAFLTSLNYAAFNVKEDPEVMFNLCLETAVQRNLYMAFDNAMKYSSTVTENTGRGWKLLALILSADQRFKDAETILEFALDEAGRLDQLELLRLKAVVQIAQERPKQAIGTYRTLLSACL